MSFVLKYNSSLLFWWKYRWLMFIYLFFYWFHQTPTIMMSMIGLLLLLRSETINSGHKWGWDSVIICPPDLFLSYRCIFNLWCDICVSNVIMANWNILRFFSKILKPFWSWSKICMISTVQELFTILKLLFSFDFFQQFILIYFLLNILNCAFLWKSWSFRPKNPFTSSFMFLLFVHTIGSRAKLWNICWNITVSIYLSLLMIILLWLIFI